MMIWMELRCGLMSAPGCVSGLNDGPKAGARDTQYAVVKTYNALRRQARKERWGYSLKAAGLACPACLKHERMAESAGIEPAAGGPATS